MGKFAGPKPSPALAVAIVALVAALAGTAIGGVAITALNKHEKKQVKKISTKQAKKLDKKIELKPGPAGPKGDKGPKGDQGDAGSPGSDAASAFTGSFGDQPLGIVERFASPSGAGPQSTSEKDVVTLSPNATIVARDLAASVGTAPGVGATRTFTLRDDGLDTSVSCTISGLDTACGGGSTTATIAPGSELSIRMTTTGFAAATVVAFGWRATTP